MQSASNFSNRYCTKGVIFDLDGLLLDTERVYFQTYRDTRRILGLSNNDDFFLSTVGKSGTDLLGVLQMDLGKALDAERFLSEWRRQNSIAFRKPVPVKPGVNTLAKQLKDLAFPYIVATNSKTDAARDRLGISGLGSLFPKIVGRDKVSKAKPSPELFLKAAQMIGVQAENCVVFEDSETGVDAALSAGMLTVHVPDMAEPSRDVNDQNYILAQSLLAGAKRVGLI